MRQSVSLVGYCH